MTTDTALFATLEAELHRTMYVYRMGKSKQGIKPETQEARRQAILDAAYQLAVQCAHEKLAQEIASRPTVTELRNGTALPATDTAEAVEIAPTRDHEELDALGLEMDGSRCQLGSECLNATAVGAKLLGSVVGPHSVEDPETGAERGAWAGAWRLPDGRIVCEDCANFYNEVAPKPAAERTVLVQLHDGDTARVAL